MACITPAWSSGGHALKYARKYSKRTKKWHAEPVKMDKECKYLPFLLLSVLNAAMMTRDL